MIIGLQTLLHVLCLIVLFIVDDRERESLSFAAISNRRPSRFERRVWLFQLRCVTAIQLTFSNGFQYQLTLIETDKTEKKHDHLKFQVSAPIEAITY